MFNLVKQPGNLDTPPTFVNVYASGTIHHGGVVEIRNASNRISPASANTTHTMALGIALDYTQSASDTKVRVVPFVPGQLWEADCINGMTTAMLGIRHALNNDLTVNNTTTDIATAKGIFLAHDIPNYVSAGASNTFKIIGEFIRSNVQEDTPATTKYQFETKIIDDSSTVTTGDGKVTLFIPPEANGMNLTDVDAGVSTASSSGVVTIMIHNATDANDMLSTALTIDANEFTSYTAATPPAINGSADDVVTGDRIRIDVDTAGTGAKGLTVILTFQLP